MNKEEKVICKICGQEVNKNGFPLHLYNKHGVKLTDYRKQYEQQEQEEEEPEKPKIRIKDVAWLNKKEYVALFENMEIIEPVAIGTVAADGEEVPSLLILATDGRLIPPWFLPGFRGIYSRKDAGRIVKEMKREHKKNRNNRTTTNNLLKELRNE